MEKPQLFTEAEVDAVAWKFAWLGAMGGTIMTGILFLVFTI